MKKATVLLVFTALCAAAFAQNANNFTIEMVQVPGGSFQMGKELGKAGSGDVTPIHTVTLTGFYMSKYPVTQNQYQAVMGTNPSSFTGGNNPVENVTWYDAVEFCNKLSVLEGKQQVYTISGRNPEAGYPITSATVTADWSKNGYRLPTEAQWEYAAKGGNPSAAGWTGYTYSGSDTYDDVAWFDGNSGRRTREVGQKKPNRLGLYDMSGNGAGTGTGSIRIRRRLIPWALMLAAAGCFAAGVGASMPLARSIGAATIRTSGSTA
jgi:formylglycine-generating enzyme required for sulfatase activity